MMNLWGDILKGVDSLFNGGSRAKAAARTAEANARAAAARAAADQAKEIARAKSSKTIVYGGIAAATILVVGMLYMGVKKS